MAQKIQVLLVCDYCEDGTAGDETVTFGVDGSNYEIDLCEAHAEELREAVAAFAGSARRAGGSRRGRRSASGTGDRQRVQEIRAWAKKKGLKVSERGRIAGDIVAQYEAAQR